MAQLARTARQAAVGIVRVLREAGFAAYLAGGCVRDELLGLDPKDYDVATDAPPEAVRRLFKCCRLVGEAFGVVLVRRRGGLAGAGLWIEVATFRKDMKYVDGRRPEGVVFSDAREDALRRDFTINGLFEDPLAEDPDSAIIDYVGGLEDLKRRRIRAIGDPEERFSEDYLRMLRAVRFAARLKFQLEAKTAAAIREHAGKLAAVSRERIGQEVGWMLRGPDPVRAARMMQRLGLDAPVLQEPHKAATLALLKAATERIGYRASDDHVAGTNENGQYAVVLTAWLLDRHLGGQANAESFVKRMLAVVEGWRAALCLTNLQSEAMTRYIRLLARSAGWLKLGVAQKKRLLAERDWPGAALLLQALARARPRNGLAAGPTWARVWKAVKAETPRLVQQGVAPPRLVTGDDLVQAGIKPGPALGRLLEAIYDAQLEGRVTTKAQGLKLAREARRQ